MGPNYGAASRKFSDEQVIEMRRNWRNHWTPAGIGRWFKCGRQTATSAIRGQTYGHVPGAVTPEEWASRYER